jgi:NTP pyrophosphatase (non-canonical NTP hydrolase)
MNSLDMQALDILQEECAEVIQAASKIKRWGPDSTNRGQNPHSNRDLLAMEIGDVLAMIDIVQERFGISSYELNLHRMKKKEKLKIYSQLFDDEKSSPNK